MAALNDGIRVKLDHCVAQSGMEPSQFRDIAIGVIGTHNIRCCPIRPPRVPLERSEVKVRCDMKRDAEGESTHPQSELKPASRSPIADLIITRRQFGCNQRCIQGRVRGLQLKEPLRGAP